ncbi:MAG: type VI secretion system baseplate subunit TssF [Myxococcales bacterium]|nr:MAG: type VI secretion system baseplate subunit TssF [Myxococcales bacterium]
MDHRLLSYYNRELSYLRELGGEFAKHFPKIAGRLGLDEFECTDPYVERLLEGFAFLAARVQLKIDAEYPRFTQGLMSILAPHLLAPTPSLAVVQFRPSTKQGGLAEGHTIARGTALKAPLGRGEQTACEYRTSQEVELWPLEITRVTHTGHVGDLGDLRTDSRRPVKSALRIRLRSSGPPLSKLTVKTLPLFLRGAEQLGMRLYELLAGGAVGLVGLDGNGRRIGFVPGSPVRAMGLSDDEALLNYDLRSFQGYRLLHEYFALPQRFLFVELLSLAQLFEQCSTPELELVVLLDRRDAVVEASVSSDHLALFCAPVINLFPKKADRIHLSERESEYHVVADRTRPLDFEVHSVTAVSGVGAGAAAARPFLPFYACTERHNAETQAYFTLHRQPRLISSRRAVTGPRSTYAGSEVFVSLVDGNEGPYHTDLKQLAVDTLCTNRDLPLLMSLGTGKTDFTLDTGAPVESIRCVAGPSEPHASPAWGESSWRLVSHLSLNHLSVANAQDDLGPAPLRQLLQLYGDLGSAVLRREIEGIRSVTTASVTRRLPFDGPASFARGLELTLDCDEAYFEGGSCFLLGAVLERFFARLVGLNSFTETVLRTPQRGEIMRWPTRLGQRSNA